MIVRIEALTKSRKDNTRMLRIENTDGKTWTQVADSSDMARLWTEVRKLEGYTDADTE